MFYNFFFFLHKMAIQYFEYFKQSISLCHTHTPTLNRNLIAFHWIAHFPNITCPPFINYHLINTQYQRNGLRLTKFMNFQIYISLWIKFTECRFKRKIDHSNIYRFIWLESKNNILTILAVILLFNMYIWKLNLTISSFSLALISIYF